MKTKRCLPALMLLLTCLLIMPVSVYGSAMPVCDQASVTGFVSSIQTMEGYTNAFNSAASAQDVLRIANGAKFQQDVQTLITHYNALRSGGWIAGSSAQTLGFQQGMQNLLSRAKELNNTVSTGRIGLVINGYFLQDIVNFMDGYNRLPNSLYTGTYPISPYPDGSGGTVSGFYPVYDLRAGIAATLTMKMATRLGPGTAYSEELGTMPQTTPITVFEQVTPNGVPWVMVEYTYKNRLYRAYTGMKRISAGQPVPQGNTQPQAARALQQTAAYYGPGYHYAQHDAVVPANTALEVYGVENGFLLCDYLGEEKMIRAYIPLDSRVQ